MKWEGSEIGSGEVEVKVEVKDVDQIEIVDKVECAVGTSATHNSLTYYVSQLFQM